MNILIYEPRHDKTNETCAPSEDSHQPGHPPSLISLRCVLNGLLRTQSFFMRTAKTLIRLGGCPGWSESSLGAHSFCWFCHVAAHMLTIDEPPVGPSWKLSDLFKLCCSTKSRIKCTEPDSNREPLDHQTCILPLQCRTCWDFTVEIKSNKIAWTFAARIGDKYQICLTSPNDSSHDHQFGFRFLLRRVLFWDLSCWVFPCLFSVLFSIVITSLGEGRAGLYASHAFGLCMFILHALHWCRWLSADCDCDTPWTFHLPFW